MGEKFSDSDATRIIAALDSRAERRLKNGATIQTTWATIGEIDVANKFASAYLYGETDGAYLSGGFRIPETMYLTLGDVVKVAINYATGDRWIEEVKVPATAYKKIALDQNTGQVLTGDGTVPPAASAGVPVGTVVQYAGSSAPAGWLLCDGAAIDRDDYAALFAAIGTGYGVGDGSTTFNIPDTRDKYSKGKNAGALGATGGAATHTHAGHSAHSDHTFTQPSAHAALSHSAHSGGAVSAHAGTAVSAHSGTAVSAHAAHTHETPFIDNGAQTLSTTQADFGNGGSRTRSWTGSFSAASGSYPVAQVSDTTVGAHSVTQPAAHTVTQPSDHTFTQPSAHSDHASMTHTGGAVNAHSAHSAHDTPNSEPPYLVFNYIIKF